MILENLYFLKKNKKRIGRGQGSGKGGTSTKGHKGAKSRSGYSKKIGFEGGQTPLQRRIPKFGFKKHMRNTYLCLNIELLQAYVKNKILSKEITPDLIKQISSIWVAKKELIKILGFDVLTSALKISANKFSKSSIESIKNAGGEVIHIL